MMTTIVKPAATVSCAVPVCKNTVLNCPTKKFFYITTKSKASQAPGQTEIPSGSFYLCKDHVNNVKIYKDLRQKICNNPLLKPSQSSLTNIDRNRSLGLELSKKKVCKARFRPRELGTLSVKDTLALTTPEYIEVEIDPLPGMHEPDTLNTDDREVERIPYCFGVPDIELTVTTCSDNSKTVSEGNASEAAGKQKPSEKQDTSKSSSTTIVSENESLDFKIHNSFLPKFFMPNLIENKPFLYVGVP